MTRFLTLALSMAASIGVFGQAYQPQSQAYTIANKVHTVMDQPESRITPAEYRQWYDQRFAYLTNNKSAGPIETLINFPLSIYDWYQQTMLTTSFLELYPDSSVTVEYTSAHMAPFNHAVGGIFDPDLDDQFANTNNWAIDHNKPVYVDTLFIDGIYFRHQAADDSLVLEITIGQEDLVDFAGQIFPAQLYTNLNSSDEPTVITMNYQGSASNGFIEGMQNRSHRFAIALTAGDTGLRTFAIPVDITLSPKQIMGYLFSFKPEAGSWKAGDTISLPKNSGPNYFRPLIWANESTADQSAYFLDFWKEGGINCSNFVYSDTRYNAWTGADIWRNDQTTTIPEIASSTYYYVRATEKPVGIDEVVEKVVLSQNYPNPFGINTNIQYALSSPAALSVEIYDLTGKLVKVIDRGVQPAGQYTMELNATEFDNGLYYYTLNADDVRVTKKMTVLK